MTKLSEKELFKIRDYLKRKKEMILRKDQQLFLKAKVDFDKIVLMIIKEYKPKRIYQWGSLLKKENFSTISDIDIAIEGITDPKKYFRLLGEADALTKFPLDIVQIEKIHPFHAKSIKEKGKVIYEEKK